MAGKGAFGFTLPLPSFFPPEVFFSPYMDVITEKQKPLGWYFNLSEIKTNLTNPNKLTFMDILQ